MDVLPQIQPCTPEAYELIHQGLLAFTDSTQNGMRIDLDYCQKQTKILKSKIKINQKNIRVYLWCYLCPKFDDERTV
jgi:ribosomal protein S8